MKSPAELQQIHDHMQGILHEVINQGLKFELCTSVARQIIRLDYNALTLEMLPKSFNHIEEEVIQIKIDPATTAEKVYHQIIKNIYQVSKLNTSIKDSKQFSKEKKLILLIEINYLHNYKKMSQIQIGDYLREHNIASINHSFSAEAFSKEVYRYIQKINAIKETYNLITPNQYLLS
jgi:hypothetical protein